MHWFTPQIPTGLSWSQEPRAQIRSPTWEAVTQALDTLPAASLCMNRKLDQKQSWVNQTSRDASSTLLPTLTLNLYFNSMSTSFVKYPFTVQFYWTSQIPAHFSHWIKVEGETYAVYCLETSVLLNCEFFKRIWKEVRSPPNATQPDMESKRHRRNFESVLKFWSFIFLFNSLSIFFMKKGVSSFLLLVYRVACEMSTEYRMLWWMYVDLVVQRCGPRGRCLAGVWDSCISPSSV